jgi:hypothetical protein
MRRYIFEMDGVEAYDSFEAILFSDEEARTYAKKLAAKFSRSKLEAIVVRDDFGEILFRCPILHRVGD